MSEIPWQNFEDEKQAARGREKLLAYALIVFTMVLIICGFILGCPRHAHASEIPVIPAKQAINAIIGEAENQGFVGMLAVAHAIRNRGSLHGVYGATSFRVRHHLYSQKIYRMANLAWEQSAIDYDITKGAQGWGNANDLKAFAKCKWWRNCTVTFMYKDHWFYRKGLIL